MKLQIVSDIHLVFALKELSSVRSCLVLTELIQKIASYTGNLTQWSFHSDSGGTFLLAIATSVTQLD